MESIISKLQEGVKYPRFERDATKTINDLVEHITKERGVYSSSIEPNPNEHNIWFNTNDNTLYIYNKGIWKIINNKNTDTLDAPFIFYCTSGTLYYHTLDVNNGSNGIYISGFYDEARLRYVIENSEGRSIENITLQGIFIEPEDFSIIIIGKQDFEVNITILGSDLDNPKIYMYNTILPIGDDTDSVVNINNINWFIATVYCNCKEIGDINITHENSNFNLYIEEVNFIVGNNNKLIIDNSVCNVIDLCNIYVIKETNNDNSSVSIGNDMAGGIDSYINLCGTAVGGSNDRNIFINTFITTTIDDIDKNAPNYGPINIRTCKVLIVDAPYRAFKYTSYLDDLKSYSNNNNLQIYVTDEQLFNFLKGKGIKCEMVIENNRYFDDKVVVNYKTSDGTDIYNETIYKR